MTAHSVPVARAQPEAVDIDLRRLRFFRAVCELGGISKAAAATGIPQPALTRHTKLLEQQIGMPLILRSGRGVAPS
jgi:LysR family nitrogen assimilation transcriptional regulator